MSKKLQTIIVLTFCFAMAVIGFASAPVNIRRASSSTSTSSTTGTSLDLNPGPLKVGSGGIYTDGGVSFPSTDAFPLVFNSPTFNSYFNYTAGSGSLAYTALGNQLILFNGTTGVTSSTYGFLASGAAFTSSVAAGASGYGLNLSAGGKVKVTYTDNSGSPGNTTINMPSGRAAVLSGVGGIQVTNSTVTSTSGVIITPMSSFTLDCQGWFVTTNSGNFTVTCPAGNTNDWLFQFYVYN